MGLKAAKSSVALKFEAFSRLTMHNDWTRSGHFFYSGKYMAKIATSVPSALSAAETSGEALVNLLNLYKEAARPMSLAAICKKSGIPSKGYLSDVLNGRRKISRKYWETICDAFGLEGASRRHLQLLIKRDYADGKDKTKFNADLAAVMRSYEMPEVEFPKTLKNPILACDIFAAFAIFSGSPTRNQLVKLFGRSRYEECDLTLASLEKHNLIERSGSRYLLKFRNIRFLDKPGPGLMLKDFIKSSIASAAEEVEHQIADSKNTFFESLVVSIKQEDLPRAIANLRGLLEQWVLSIEQEAADALLRYNVQIFPVVKIKTSKK